MEKLSDKNLANSGWHCSHCGAFNKVAAARFCGHCGTARVTQSEQATEATDTNFNNSIDAKPSITNQGPQSAIAHIKNWFLPGAEKAYKIVIAGACCLLITSVLCGYQMYTNVDTIRLARTSFSDIPVDHPVYEVCNKLLSIDAISFRRNHELAPYENISAAEWNHALKQAFKHLDKEFPQEAFFAEKDAISVDSLNAKFRLLRADAPELTDSSRIQSFYLLERTLFN